jgi:hypothetical protein
VESDGVGRASESGCCAAHGAAIRRASRTRRGGAWKRGGVGAYKSERLNIGGAARESKGSKVSGKKAVKTYSSGRAAGERRRGKREFERLRFPFPFLEVTSLQLFPLFDRMKI